MLGSLCVSDMEETYGEYKEWQGGTVDEDIQKSYDRALDLLKKVKPFEQQLVRKDIHTMTYSVMQYSAVLILSKGVGGWLVVGCLTSQQHVSVSQGRICTILRAATLR